MEEEEERARRWLEARRRAIVGGASEWSVGLTVAVGERGQKERHHLSAKSTDGKTDG
jgi:hypothetical protein